MGFQNPKIANYQQKLLESSNRNISLNRVRVLIYYYNNFGVPTHDTALHAMQKIISLTLIHTNLPETKELE
jgi:hypothetical protein